MLTLEQYAVAQAHLLHFDKTAAQKVRKSLGVADVWGESQEHWLSILHDSMLSEDKTEARLFAGELASTQSELTDKQPALEQITPILEAPIAAGDYVAVDATRLETPAIEDEPLPFGDEPSPEYASRLGAAANVETEAVAAGATEGFDTGSPETMEALRSRFTLAQYASLSAEMASRPQQHMAILEKYNLANDKELMTLMSAWASYFGQYPDERDRWQQAVNTYSEYLKTESR